ncbi:MAG: GNAT family N-acetyltransferase [Rubrivivax sp.]|nr:GNAT family N-acetyltransferase [Rubrivivax sp.]
MTRAVRVVDLAHGATAAEWMALSCAAHWNQTEDDWRAMLALGRGWGLRGADPDTGRDTLVASTLVLPYREPFAGARSGSGFAWISMVLVLPEWRGRGFAERLLRVALDHLAAARLRPVLDATPAGRPVYAKLGFVEGWPFTRWRRRFAPSSVPPAAGEGTGEAAGVCRRLRQDDWTAIGRLDTPAFGADRTALLAGLAQRLPAAAWVAADAEGLHGYLLGRDGRTALQLGPLVTAAANDEACAMRLLDAAIGPVARLAAARGLDVIADVRDGCASLAQGLRQHGFAAERPFVRMVHGAAAAPGDAARIMLPAGPELG